MKAYVSTFHPVQRNYSVNSEQSDYAESTDGTFIPLDLYTGSCKWQSQLASNSI